ncbi:MAG: glucose 1-dehydrogenase [Desulfobacterales bacterium]|nr:MAG: glucose 1-dehydrogenase [Desulfobacterales bacterium]
MILDKFNLSGKSGIVTGAGSGIGRAIAGGLAEAGAEVVVAGRNLAKLEKTVREYSGAGGRLVPLTVDMKHRESIQSLVDRTVSEFGKINFLFNNAGTIHRQPSEEHSSEAWDEVLQVNLTGPFLLAQAVARVMISKRIKGKIINTSSLIAVFGGKTVPSYAASKGGLSQLTKAMCNDFGQYGINVNAIGPGWVKTELTQALQKNEERYTEITARIPLGRWADPQDLAGTAVFLASAASDYISGQVIFVDGGYLAL